MTRTFLKIFAFMLAVVGVYAYVGQLVPQFEEHPPAKKVVTPETPRGELVAIGEELLRGKGGCLICHKVTEQGNERGPDLRQAAARAATRKAGAGVEAAGAPSVARGPRLDPIGEAYLVESLVSPDAFIVPGYPKMMPPALKPPANLSMAEAKAVVAYLQSLGGVEVTVKVEAADVAAEKKPGGPVHRGKALMQEQGCIGCHKVEGEGGEVGPALTGIAERVEPAKIARKIADPKLWTAAGYPAGLMPPRPDMPEGDRQEIAAYLAGLSGKDYSATGAASPWSHEGVRLGLVIFVFNAGMLVALGLARRRLPARGAQAGKRGDA